MVQLAPRENPYLGGAGGFGGDQAVQRGDRAQSSTPRCCGSSARATTRRKRLLREHRKQLDALAAALLSRETLDEQEILEVTGLPPAPALPSRTIPISHAGR